MIAWINFVPLAVLARVAFCSVCKWMKVVLLSSVCPGLLRSSRSVHLRCQCDNFLPDADPWRRGRPVLGEAGGAPSLWQLSLCCLCQSSCLATGCVTGKEELPGWLKVCAMGTPVPLNSRVPISGHHKGTWLFTGTEHLLCGCGYCRRF